MCENNLVSLTKGSDMTVVIFLSAWMMNSANKFFITYSPGFNKISTCVLLVDAWIPLSFLENQGSILLLGMFPTFVDSSLILGDCISIKKNSY